MSRPKTIIRRQSDSETEAGYKKDAKVIEARLLNSLDRRKEFKSKSERIAQDDICQQNWKFRDATKYFPDEPWMRTVSKYYPNASCGPLLIDEPQLDIEITRCQRKQVVLEGMGYRYLILRPNMTDAECFMEIEACGQRLKTQSPT